MPRHTVLLVVALIAILALAPTAVSQHQVSVSGKITDERGKPLEGAKVIFYVYARLSPEVTQRFYIFECGPDGTFSGSVDSRAQYIVYVFHRTSEKAYVPAILDLRDISKMSALTLHVTLPEAALLMIKGYPAYLGGKWVGKYGVRVLDKAGEPLHLHVGTATVTTTDGQVLTVELLALNEYGTVDHVYRLHEAVGLDYREALVPSGLELRLEVYFLVLDIREERVKRIFTFMGSAEEPLVLRGFDNSVDLLSLSLQGSLAAVRREIDLAEGLLNEYEALGFYMPEQRMLLKEATTRLKEAESLAAEGAPPSSVIPLLERAYTIAHYIIPRDVYLLRETAREGGLILPLFLAFFAAVLSFYLFENRKKKTLSFAAFYLLLVALFTLVYPGFPLLWKLDKLLFLASVAGSFAVAFVVLFILPRYAPEPEVPERITTLSALAIAFTLAKRFSKIKRFRTIVTVFSLAAFIWAFTVLATFSTVYAKTTVQAPIQVPETLLVMRNLEAGVPAPLNPVLDVSMLSDKLTPYPRAHELPDAKLTVRLRYGGREAVIHHLLGIAEGDPVVSKILKQTPKENEILLPKSLWERLRVATGAEIELVIEHPDYGRDVVKLKAIGWFDEQALAEAKDPDAYPLLPFVVSKGRVEWSNSSDTAIVNWKFLLRTLRPRGSEFSGVFDVYSVAAIPLPDADITALAHEILERRGGGYVVTYCTTGRCFTLKYGVKIESIFEQEAAFAIPLIIVIFNVTVTMLSIVKERRREIFIFVTTGFNPTHIAMVFLAEAVIYGLLAGGLGYVAGLATFRALKEIAGAQNLLVREKLEWYWSFLAVVAAVIVSALGSFKPAMEAAFMFAPSKVKRVKAPPKVIEERRREIARTVATKVYTFPQRIEPSEIEFFCPYVYDRLSDLRFGTLERVENLKEHEEEELPDGTLVKKISFDYIVVSDREKTIMKSELRIIKEPGDKKYRVELEIKPKGEAPITLMEHVARLIRDILRGWSEERKRILSV